MRSTIRLSTVLTSTVVILAKFQQSNAFSSTSLTQLGGFTRPLTLTKALVLQMKKGDPRKGGTDELPALSAASVSDGFSPSKILQGSRYGENVFKSLSEDTQKVLPVISAALLITSCTVGASMMVLPDLAQGPGLITSTGIISVLYAINLVSGLLIAEVGINQYEQSSREVPSSFKEFADANLQSDKAANFISATSLFTNTCVLSFDFVRASELSASALTKETLLPGFGHELIETLSSSLHSGHTALIAVAIFFASLVATQSDRTLSGIASICCIALFASFTGLVLPGLATIHDPIAVFMAAGTSEFGSPDFFHDISSCVPVFLTAMIYQNIVPTVTKSLNYDRTQVVAAVALGSLIPMIMYISFCFTVLGGGAVSGVGAGSTFLDVIKASSVFGSALACVISIGEELNCYLPSPSEKALESYGVEIEMTKEDKKMSFVPYVLGVIPPVLVGVNFSGGEGFVGALQVSGSYGSPLLYGIIPVVLAFSQRIRTEPNNRLVPGGLVPLGVLTLAAGALITTHLIEDVSSLASWVQ